MNQLTKRSPKKEILDTATQLFYRHGYRVGVDRIIAEAGVAKMTFYKYFPAKSELIKAVIERIHQRIELRLRAIAADVTQSPLTRALKTCDFLVRSMMGSAYCGILIPQALIEIHDRESAPVLMAAVCASEMRVALSSACREAGIRRPTLAQELQLVIIGGAILQRVFGTASVAQLVKVSVQDLIHLSQADPPKAWTDKLKRR